MADKYVSIAQAAVALQESQNCILNAIGGLGDLASSIHDHLTGSADDYVKRELLKHVLAVDAHLRKAVL